MVMLKPLARALADGDHLYGVIRGSGCVQGSRLPGEPGDSDARAREDFLRAVHQRAGIDTETLSYVEAHGAGPRSEDEVELEALRRVFQARTSRTGFCALGSVKGVLGHAVSASGMAGLLKILLAFEHRQLPASFPTLTPTELRRFEQTPFRVDSQPRPWEGAEGAPRRAALSAFGSNGTDCHLVLEEPPARAPRAGTPDRPAYLFVLSARTDTALRQLASALTARLTDWLSGDTAPHPGDVAYALARRAGAGEKRVAFVASDLQELKARLLGFRDVPGTHEAVGAARAALSGASSRLLSGLSGRLLQDLSPDAPRALWRDTLEAVAEFQGLGMDLERSVLFPHGVYRCVPLPSEPFVREPCGMGADSAPGGSAPEALPSPAALAPVVREEPPAVPILLPENALLLEEGWRAVEAPVRGEGPDLQGLLVVLVNAETLPLARIALAAFEGVRPRFIADCGMPGPGIYALLDFDNHEAGIRLGEELNAKAEPLAGILDLSDLRATPGDESEVARMDALGRIGLLQTLLKRVRGEPLSLLHFTRGLRTFMSRGPFDLTGGVMAALVSKLGTEYAGLHARTVDLERLPADAAALATMIKQELLDRDSGGEVLLRDGGRYEPELRPLLSTPAPARRLSADKVYVITGGVRGIGLEVARHLVTRGARRLLLMGVQPLPPQEEWTALLAHPGTAPSLRERIAPLRALEAQGVRLRVHTGSLTDASALATVLAGVRSSLGPIGGCVHSAGAVFFDPPAFIGKPLRHLRGVLEPKVDGLRALERALAPDALEFFVFFSSVSARVPALAVGIVDYSAANTFMNLLAEQRRALGRTPYQSIVWPNWRDVGMGEVGSAAYRALGFTAHSTADGLALLDAALSSQRPVLLPAIVEPSRFSSEALLRSRARPRAPRAAPREVTPAGVPSETPSVSAPTPRVSVHAEMRAQTEQWLRQLLARELKLEEARIGSETDFEALGVDSIHVIELVTKMDEWLGVKLDPTLPLVHRTLAQLRDHLVEAHPEAVLGTFAPGAVIEAAPPRAEPQAAPPVASAPVAAPSGPEPIAVIGMACHFPGSPDLESYWRVLREGRDLITEVPASRWRTADVYSSTHQPGRSIGRWGGFIEGIEQFDPDYFHIAREDAPCIDPLMRQFLEVSVQCLHHAGYAPREVAGRRVGVFVGSRMSGYASRMPAPTRNGVLGSGQNFIAAHVSHFLDLKGPGLVVDTACSSSLVGIHLACQSLLSGESELALAGGVDILLDEGVYLTLSESRALSRDGRCKTFDEKADGFVPGEGAGAVLLKPLSKALADGDRVYGIIDATAVNNDGHTMGATTPNPAGQRAVIQEALRKGGVDARTVSYVEAHGTGTMLGDPIELKALTEVLAPAGARPGTCAVGSVKSNFGHLLSAAGVAGFIKVVLSLMHRELPPTLHCTTPNPRFRFETSPLFPNTTLREWAPLEGVRRAGLSAFGFGGTNAHALVSEAPEHQRPMRAPLPPVVFSRQRYWLEAPAGRSAPVSAAGGTARPRRPLVALELDAVG
ncbi:beta-ketoacyl synthase N-terminal-like domain-containing protein [Melittangium boletus]|uniref:beta-ketoacyl synthase N-terminal-like domain-containing protein n=1 Tax=Melittangium boletus TaxID=83453 RepID=UPI003DA53FC4